MLNTNERIIKHKVGLSNLAEELGNVSKACQVMGLSRDTFYRYKDAVESGGVEALLDADRRKPKPWCPGPAKVCFDACRAIERIVPVLVGIFTVQMLQDADLTDIGA